MYPQVSTVTALEYPNTTDRWQVRQVFKNDRQEGNTEEDKNGLIVFIKNFHGSAFR